MLLKFLKSFLRIKSKPKIRFYSLTPGVKEVWPIIKSSELKRPFQSWPVEPKVPPVNNCPGINKISSSGFIVTAPADFIIKTNGDKNSIEWLEPYRFDNGDNKESYVNAHGPAQTMPLINDDRSINTVVKIETPWRVDLDRDYVFLQIPVVYHPEQRFTAAIGILDPKHAHLINVQLFWHVLNGETLVRAGTPLCQLIPIRRSDLNLYQYNFLVQDADEDDIEKEKAFNYASKCTFLSHDSLGSRIRRTTKIFNKYVKGD